MLASTLRQLRSSGATRALISQSAQSLGGATHFSAAAQPSDSKTILAILYKAGAAAEEKRLLGTNFPFQHVHALSCNRPL